MSKRKRICMFMGELSLDFQHESCDLINRFCKERDIDAVLYASYGSYIGPYGRNPFFELGEKNVILLPDFSTFDAIFVFPDTFDVYGMDNELYALIKKEATCPVISIRNGSSDYPIVTLNNQEIFKTVTNHFIKGHGFKNICFMSGPIDQKDGLARYEGYVSAMQEAGLPIKNNFFFEGNYWRNKGHLAIAKFLDCPPEDYPEAIICANDYMAFSILDELNKRGIRVPEDICVSGFDNISDCESMSPTLTTVKVKTDSFISKAFDAVEAIWAGEEIPRKIYVDYELIFRESCGCGKVKPFIDIIEVNNKLTYFDNLIRDNSRMVAEYQNSFAFDNTMVVAAHYFGIFGCQKGLLCLCDEDDPVYMSVEANKVYSDTMVLKRIMFSDRGIKPVACDQKFSRSDVIPAEYMNQDEATFTIVYTIHYRSKAYGYIALLPAIGETPNLFTNLYLNSLASALESSFVQAQYLEMDEIKKEYLLDPLTGVYNRRGYEKLMQAIVNSVSADPDEYISICSIDMDNLKHINDDFGHKEGDFAILALVDVINSCISGKDFVARMGGDEFMAVLVGGDIERHIEFREKFEKRLVRRSVESGKPYKIHASIGISGPEKISGLSLFESMQNADEKMYENKRRYKSSLKE